MTKVYIIRHAEAEGNLYRRMHGWYDSMVTDLGMRQLDAVAERFRDIKLDAVYSSDLTRTRMTAEAVARYSGVEVVTTKRLREVNLGVWEDHTWGDAALWAPEQLANFNSDPANWSVEGSEPFYETQARMMAVLKELSQKHDGGTIALVSHGAAIRSLIAALTGVPSNEITKIRHCDNTAVTEMTVDNSTGTVEIAYMGDGSHLGEAGTRFVRQDWWKSNVGYDATSMRFVGLDKENDEADYRLIRPDGDWERACLRAGKNANAAVWCICMNERAGFTELDIDRDADESIGWIDYYAMFPEWRGRFLSVQLLGHAVSLYRGLGREKIRICADGETAGYFEHFGFESIGGGILEKDIKI